LKFKETKPCAALEPYIHSFWELKGADNDKQWERNFPDACPGLVVNLGDTCVTDSGAATMDFAKTYVVGTMTTFKDSFIEVNTHLLGVCMKPGAFSNFYDFVAQNELRDKTVQLENRLSFDIHKLIKNPIHYLNQFLTERLQSTNGLLQSVMDDIHKSNGQLNINKIAENNFITVRRLERNFKAHIGITPKEYSNIIRFQNALLKIKSFKQGKRLADIAFECGYYDHAHLANEIKKHTGLSPTQL